MSMRPLLGKGRPWGSHQPQTPLTVPVVCLHRVSFGGQVCDSGVIGNFDLFKINSDENPFYIIIVRCAEFLKMFVPVRIVLLYPLRDAHKVCPQAPAVCGRVHAERSSWVGCLPWLLSPKLQRVVGALLPAETEPRPFRSIRVPCSRALDSQPQAT